MTILYLTILQRDDCKTSILLVHSVDIVEYIYSIDPVNFIDPVI